MVIQATSARFRPLPRFLAQNIAGSTKPSAKRLFSKTSRPPFTYDNPPKSSLFSKWSSEWKASFKNPLRYAGFQQSRLYHGYSFGSSRPRKKAINDFATGLLRYYYRGFGSPASHVRYKKNNKLYKRKCIHVRRQPHWKVKAAAATWIRKPHSACRTMEMHQRLDKYRLPVNALPTLSTEQNAFRPMTKVAYFGRIPTSAFNASTEQSSSLIYLRKKVGQLAATAANHDSYDSNRDNRDGHGFSNGLHNSHNARLAAAVMNRSHHLFCPRKGCLRQYSIAASMRSLRPGPPKPGLRQSIPYRRLTSTSWAAASESSHIAPWKFDEYGHEFADSKKRDKCLAMQRAGGQLIQTYMASKPCRHVTCTTPGVCSFYPASEAASYRLKKVEQPIEEQVAGLSTSALPKTFPTRPTPRSSSPFVPQLVSVRQGSVRCYTTVPCNTLFAEAGQAIRATLASPQLLSKVTSVARILLSLFPLSLRSRYIHLSRNTSAHLFNRGFFTWSLLILPVTLLMGILAANVSRTPISGRPRLLLMNRETEQSIVQHFYNSTLSNQSAFAQWYFILRQLSGEEHAERGTLFGGKVLEPTSEWKQHWVEGVVRALEGNLGNLDKARSIGNFAIPGTGHQLPCSAGKSKYTVLLVDSPEVNAFSFGWPPGTEIPVGATPGVIVVFSGLLDSILASSTSAKQSNGQVMPSAEQTRQLAVLMSHELSHLLLGHTLEAYANKNLVWPKIRSMAVDVARTIFWPITAMLGPFVNEGLSNAAKQLVLPPNSPESDTSVWVDDLRSASFSRKMELEADLVGLRLLANANISPEEAQIFWQRRCAADEDTSSGISSSAGHHHSSANHSVGCYLWDQKNAESSHPGNLQRLQAVQEVLQNWADRKTSKSWLSTIFS